MTQRYVVASRHPDYDIEVTTEQRASGTWAVVANVVHTSPTGLSTRPIAVPDSDYSNESEARNAGVESAQAWIGENAPQEEPDTRR